MGYVTYESYYLRDIELQILLAGNGKSRWYGFIQNRKNRDWNIREVYQALIGLYRKGFITWDEERIVVAEPIQTIAEIVGEADICVISKVLKKDLPTHSFYIHKKRVVLLERGQTQKDSLSLTLLGEEEWMELLFEEGYFPEQAEVQTRRRRKREEYSAHAMLERVKTENGRATGSIIVEERGLSVILSIREGKTMRDIPCERSACLEILRKWIGEDRGL